MMGPEEREFHMRTVNKMIVQTGVEDVWNLTDFVSKFPPPFKFNYLVGYTVLGLVGLSSIMVDHPVHINKNMIRDLYELSDYQVEQYFNWFCHIKILKEFK